MIVRSNLWFRLFIKAFLVPVAGSTVEGWREAIFAISPFNCLISLATVCARLVTKSPAKEKLFASLSLRRRLGPSPGRELGQLLPLVRSSLAFCSERAVSVVSVLSNCSRRD